MGNKDSKEILVNGGEGILPLFKPAVQGQWFENSIEPYNPKVEAIQLVKPHNESDQKGKGRCRSMPHLIREETSSIILMASGKNKLVDLVNYTSVKPFEKSGPQGRELGPQSSIQEVKLTVCFMQGFKALLRLPIVQPESITGDWLKARFYESKRRNRIPFSGRH